MMEPGRSTGTKWWPLLGYSRAVWRGSIVRVAATAAAEVDDGVIGVSDAYAQTEQALRNLKVALAALGANVEHVVRTRVYVADLVHWPSIAQAYGEIFPESGPAKNAVGTRQFMSQDSLVEIEADALVLRDQPWDPGAEPQHPSRQL